MKTAYNLWGPEHRFFVDPVFEDRVKENNVDAKNHAALRSSIYKELFDELSKEEQLEWSKRAESEHQAALKDIEKKTNAGPSTAPEDRQRYNYIPSFCILSDQCYHPELFNHWLPS